MEQDRRAPRYPFTAPAEVIVESSGVKIIARVTELSLHGCYLNTSTPISAKTPVLVKVFGTREYFEADATVVYAHPLLGVGLAFRNVKFDCRSVLHKWLLAAMHNEPKTNWLWRPDARFH
jgi:PilZ domain